MSFNTARQPHLRRDQRHGRQGQQRRARPDRRHRRRRRHPRLAAKSATAPSSSPPETPTAEHASSKKASSPSPRTARSATTTAPLTVNGGCLASSGSFALTRDVAIGANGGNIRADEVGAHHGDRRQLPNWSTTTTTIDGMGRTVISGTTPGPWTEISWSARPSPSPPAPPFPPVGVHRVCLLGAAALPAGEI